LMGSWTLRWVNSSVWVTGTWVESFMYGTLGWTTSEILDYIRDLNCLKNGFLPAGNHIGNFSKHFSSSHVFDSTFALFLI
jgi:hypothetical protein